LIEGKRNDKNAAKAGIRKPFIISWLKPTAIDRILQKKGKTKKSFSQVIDD